MTINKFNYEAYALDYIEGNLSGEILEEMKYFLLANPAIEAELMDMKMLVTLEPDESIVYEHKASLLKEEKTFFLNKKWVRPLIVAASFALLISVYFIGYQAGTNESVVVAEPTNTNEINIVPPAIKANKATDLLSSSVKETAPDITKPKQELPAQTRKKQTIPSVKKEVIIAKNKKQTILPIKENPPILVEAFKPIIKETAVEANLPIKEMVENLEEATISVNVIVVLPLKKIETKPIKSQIEKITNLENALLDKIEVNPAYLASARKKRSFKDFLGKFPVMDIKDALIPSYYKEVEEEVAGQ
jgi:hypothetical protein